MADLSISKNMTSSAFQPFAEYATIKKPQKSTTFYSTKHDNSNISPAPAPVELIHSRDTVQALPVHPNGAFIPIKQMTSTMHCSTPSGSSTSTITSPNNRNSLQINNQNNTTPLRIPQPPYSRHSSSPSSSSSTPTPNSSSMTRFPPQNNSTRSSITSIKPQIIGAGSGNAAAAVAAALHVAKPDMSSKTFNELVEIARQQQQQIEANKIELDERKKLIESTKMQNGNNVSTMAEKLRVLRAEIAKDERDLSQLSEAQRKAKQISLQNEIKRAELMTLQETYAQDEQQLRHAVDKVDSLKKQMETINNIDLNIYKNYSKFNINGLLNESNKLSDTMLSSSSSSSSSLSTSPSSTSSSSIITSKSTVFHPWIKSQKTYACQRCLNHNITVARKDHKKICPYSTCQCPNCELVDKRRELNAELARVKLMDLKDNLTENSQNRNIPIVSENTERLPHCQRCAQHNVQNRLKGHKKYCQFKDCQCAKCKVVVERQRLMADQIKLRRRQKKQKINHLKKQEKKQNSDYSLNLSDNASTSSTSTSTFTSNTLSIPSIPSTNDLNNYDIKNKSDKLEIENKVNEIVDGQDTIFPHQQNNLQQLMPVMPSMMTNFQLLMTFYALQQQQMISNNQQHFYPIKFDNISSLL